ncbi:MAG: ABC transporter ATP-binding protein, partial [Deltaproteobacteria bacterium]
LWSGWKRMSGVRVENLVKRWGDFRAVDKVSFEAPEGTLTVLLGPSGCGKSTILRLIAGLEFAESGSVLIDNKDVTQSDPAKRSVSMVFQSYALFPHLDVRENIIFGLKVRKVPSAEREARLRTAAEMVGLDQLLSRKPAQLSGGQRQRVALARAIVANQPVCLMDEPLSNLDAKLRAEMREEIHRLQRNLNLTMIYVTHDQTEAMSMADQVVLLKDGRIVQVGAPADLYDTPSSVFAAQFLGTPPMNILPKKIVPALSGTPESVDLIGIRPEKIQLSHDGIPMTVDAIDYMGAETVLRMLYQNHRMMVRIDGKAQVSIGESVSVNWDPADCHGFDRNGNRICGSF